VVECLENNGRGLNLTWEVRDGILNSSKGREDILADTLGLPATLEGQVVRLADAVAYVNHDIADAVRAGILREADLPAAVSEGLGDSHSQRIDTLVRDIVDHSWPATGLVASGAPPRIGMSPAIKEAANALREFLFQRVYLWEDRQAEVERAKRVAAFLFEYYLKQPEEIDSDFRIPSDPAWRQAADYVAGMTDLFALNMAGRLGLGEQNP
jgi:dGTPase